MIEFVGALLRSVQASLELSLASNALLAVLLVGVVGAAAVAVVVVACRALPALVAADASGAARRLRQTADPGLLLSQSDPDAPGRARPRAPARGLAAA
ncbi:DUF6412 domain-containing protein [Agromyces sp. NPDC058104]|uniref:DUF6412 domain-containing protein n=1 Tax=Agromyces sp. NPDC058104 TaxID=3346342 RepID=UPI0036DA8B84